MGMWLLAVMTNPGQERLMVIQRCASRRRSSDVPKRRTMMGVIKWQGLPRKLAHKRFCLARRKQRKTNVLWAILCPKDMTKGLSVFPLCGPFSLDGRVTPSL